MNEFISFPEEEIPGVIAVVRRGLVEETNEHLKRELESQCAELEEYHQQSDEPDEFDLSNVGALR